MGEFLRIDTKQEKTEFGMKNILPRDIYIEFVPGLVLDVVINSNSPQSMWFIDSAYFDGFYEKYKQVTTEKKHVIDSYLFDQAFIKMMRDLRPDHEEEVGN